MRVSNRIISPSDAYSETWVERQIWQFVCFWWRLWQFDPAGAICKDMLFIWIETLYVQIYPSMEALATQASSINCPPAPDLTLRMLLFPPVLFSLGCLFAQTPVVLRSPQTDGLNVACCAIYYAMLWYCNAPNSYNDTARSVLRISIHKKTTNRGSQIPEPLLMFTSKRPLKAQISQGLSPFVQIELLKTGRAIQGQKIPPTTNYSLVTKQAVNKGLLTKWVIPTLLLTGKSGSGSFVVVVLWLPDYAIIYMRKLLGWLRLGWLKILSTILK